MLPCGLFTQRHQLFLCAALIGGVAAPCAMATSPVSLAIGQGIVLPTIASDLLRMPTQAPAILANQPGINATVLVSTDPEGEINISNAIPSGSQPRFAASADLTGNGLPDLVTTSPNTGRAYIVLQTQPGLFTLGASLPVGLTPYAPVLADLTGDALPDLIVPLRSENSIAILPNLGGGLFAAGYRIDTGTAPESVIARDLNLDGTIDLAVVCAGESSIRVHHGTTHSERVEIQFGPSSLTIPSGPTPNGLVSADFDGDGLPDLATASTGSSSVRIHYATPGGGFEEGPFLFAGTSPQSLAHADLNLDGRIDLVVANPGTQTVTVLENQGNRAFERRTVSMPFRPSRIAISDLNNDGLADVLAVSQTTAQGRVLNNQTQVVPCPGDADADLRVDLNDLNLVLSYFGTTDARADTNGDGIVDLTDLNLVLTHFGSVCGER